MALPVHSSYDRVSGYTRGKIGTFTSGVFIVKYPLTTREEEYRIRALSRKLVGNVLIRLMRVNR